MNENHDPKTGEFSSGSGGSRTPTSMLLRPADVPAKEHIRPKTTKQVDKYLAEKGIATTLVRGNGYLYFSDEASLGWYSSSVAVARVSDLTLGQWLGEYNNLKNDYRNH